MTQTAIDAYTWSVAYHNGDVLHEYDENRPDGRGWAEIGFASVKTVMLATHEVDRVHRVVVPADAQPLFFRRRYITINAAGEQGDSGCLAHCIGWKRAGETPQDEQAVYLFVLDDGSTLLTDNLQAI